MCANKSKYHQVFSHNYVIIICWPLSLRGTAAAEIEVQVLMSSHSFQDFNCLVAVVNSFQDFSCSFAVVSSQVVDCSLLMAIVG